MIDMRFKIEMNYISYEFFNDLKKVGYADGKVINDTFELDLIFIFEKERKMGYGSEALKLIEEHLISLKVLKLTGECIAQKGITQEQLNDFYNDNDYKIINGDIVKYLSHYATY